MQKKQRWHNKCTVIPILSTQTRPKSKQQSCGERYRGWRRAQLKGLWIEQCTGVLENRMLLGENTEFGCGFEKDLLREDHLSACLGADELLVKIEIG